jgi:uroporphyrin-III C-methyltransferase
MDSSLKGCVTLVGAGPGSPGLLTLDAVQALQEADSVLYDNLSSLPELLDLAPPSAERVFVGKVKDCRAKEIQDFIEDEMVLRAKRGEHVVRLKGGDPFIYGRGGEEITRLKSEGIRFRIVPGITTALAAGASTGIPLTMRNLSTAMMVVSGNGKGKTVPYDMIAQQKSKLTTVFYMALGAMPTVCGELVTRGLGSMPMAIVENATLPEQRLVVATVSTLPEVVANTSPPIDGTCIIVLGDVISCLAEPLAMRPVESGGLTVLPSRARPQSDGCLSCLRRLPCLLKELCDGSSRLEIRLVKKQC